MIARIAFVSLAVPARCNVARVRHAISIALASPVAIHASALFNSRVFALFIQYFHGFVGHSHSVKDVFTVVNVFVTTCYNFRFVDSVD